MTSKTDLEYSVQWTKTHWVIAFSAMAGPCEILVRCKNRSEAAHLALLSFLETRRIENKFSRYRSDNDIYKINNSNGAAIEVDEELANLLNYAQECYHLSKGLFDISSGVLRKAWKFDSSSFTPDPQLIKTIQKQVGWDKVEWDGCKLCMQPEMEVDLGGIGKEYAVDKVAGLLFQTSGASLMVNFGGDIRTIASENDITPWIIGIENPEQEESAVGQITLTNGGVATSGDVRRYCYVDGVRLGHILHPQTGWPIANAPRSVTVLGSYCVEAGFLATLAMLHGAEAEKFLKDEGVDFHCIR